MVKDGSGGGDDDDVYETLSRCHVNIVVVSVFSCLKN
jgi:hypothetical protein